MNAHISYKKKSTIICVALLVHICIFLLLFRSTFSPLFFNSLDQAPIIFENDETEWVTTKAAAGQFGNPEEEDSSEPDTQKEDQQAEQKQMQSQAIESEKPEEKPQEKKDTAEQKVQESEPTPYEQYDYAIKNRQEAQKNQQKKQPPFYQHFKPAQEPKQKEMTLSKLAKGFIDHLKDEGEHRIEMRGKNEGRPTDEQLKYERYFERIGWCLNNAWHIHRDSLPLDQRSDAKVNLLLEINDDGSLACCQVVESSNPQVNQYTVFLFKEASSSFPPLPAYFKQRPFKLIYSVEYTFMSAPGFSYQRRRTR